MPPATTPPTTPCPRCGFAASGKFCSNCGAPVAGARCTECGEPLSAGANFCHGCGSPAGPAVIPARASRSLTRTTATGARGGSNLPWIVAGAALVALIALVAVQSVSRGGSDAMPVGTAGAAASGGPGAIDIGSMSPEERAERLFNRVMSYSERGRSDSVQIFAPMAIAAYQMLGDLSLDQRYDLGRIAEVAGDGATAKAQADTILAAQPTHLLGLVLAANAARSRKDERAAREFLDRLAKAAPAERAKQLPEYQAHDNDITAALALAQRR